MRVTALMLAASLLSACVATPLPLPSPSRAVAIETSPSVGPASIEPTATPEPVWIRVDAAQFGGVVLDTVTTTSDGSLLGVGNWPTAEAPDGGPRHPTTWSSPDGVTWTRLADSPAFASTRARWDEVVLDVASFGGGFVAVGMEQFDDGSQANAAAWVSDDGSSWTRATVDHGPTRTMNQVLVTNAGLVAIGAARYDIHAGFGDGAAIWTSPDGRTWPRVPEAEAPPLGTSLGSVATVEGGFVASAELELSEGADRPRPPVTDGIWRSPDGVHWAPIPRTPLGLGSISHFAGDLIAIGSSDTAAGVSRPTIAHSSDGRAWTTGLLPPPARLPVGTSVYGERLVPWARGVLAFGERNDDFSAVGWSTPDGSTWTPFDPKALFGVSAIDRVVTAGGRVVLLGRLTTAAGDEPVIWLLAP